MEREPEAGPEAGMEPTKRRNDELNERHNRTLRRGLVASIIAHLLLFLIFGGDRSPLSPFAAAGPRAGDDQAAAGGALETVAVRVRQPDPIIPPPDPILAPEFDLELEELDTEIEPLDFADFDGLIGQERGIEDATGQGDGGSEAEGRFRMIPPTPRGIIIPPRGGPRGREIEVWVWVTETGRVVPDSTRLRPPTGDRSYDERVMREAASWVFEPARQGGSPVAAWSNYTITVH